MSVICIYHKNCFDGICAAWVISKRFPGCELRAMNYGDEFPFHEYGGNDRIFVVDFSFPRNIMEAIKNQVESLLVLDHHKTAQANCEGLSYCIFDMNQSGAGLAWHYFFPNRIAPLVVQYVQDRDLWKFNLLNSEEINAYIQSFPMTIESYERLYDELDHEFEECRRAGEAINRYKQTMVESICKNAAFDVNGIPTVNTSILFSEVGHELCKMYPDKPYAQYYFDRLKDNTRQWGARSIGNFDVSEIAKSKGGGGHKNAAGWQHLLSEV